MRNLKLEIDIQEYSSIDELDAVDRKLVEAAIEAQKGSYAPYPSYSNCKSTWICSIFIIQRRRSRSP